MNVPEYVSVRTFDSQQIAVSSGGKPTSVGFLVLFSQGKSYAERTGTDLFDFSDQLLHAVCEFGTAYFSALKYDGTVVPYVGFFGGFYDFRIGKTVSRCPGIISADTAIKAILAAMIGYFDKSPEIDVISECLFPQVAGIFV